MVYGPWSMAQPQRFSHGPLAMDHGQEPTDGQLAGFSARKNLGRRRMGGFRPDATLLACGPWGDTYSRSSRVAIPARLSDLERITSAMLGAAEAAGATIITHNFHHFTPARA